MAVKVVKFGGTSMADAASITKVANIVKSDSERKYVVVSAPGKRYSEDRKITDMLYSCYHDVELCGECRETFDKIRERFRGIVKELDIDINIDKYLDEVEEGIVKYRSADYAASRGEYLGGIIVSAVLGYSFIDAKDVIKFNASGDFDSELTNEYVKNAVRKTGNAVIPGFYGSDDAGNIVTFSRGGSDITGAVIARAVEASVYENWTDVDGFMTTDPRVVKDPVHIEQLTYRELRELAYMGANVLHPESIFPVRYSNIPINIRNTFNPEHKGTMIVPASDENTHNKTITGIAGKSGYSTIFIEKSMMNKELGFARRVLSVLEYYGVSFEHMPSGIDSLSLVIPDAELAGKEKAVVNRITKAVQPDHIELLSGYSLIATVGHGMSFKIGTAARLCDSLAKANVNIRMIDQGYSEMSIIVGVDTKDYEKAITAIYNEFFLEK
ncbi:MAG: aspartate kinase [Clostridia bacterium]|jgi:aspartate kinase|nr:aspartate kinase [Clostridia bacterium]